MTKSPSSKADTAVKLVLIFFISLLSFSVGTYVGKQVSETEIRKATLEADYRGETADPADDELSQMDEATTPLSDEEARALAEEYVDTERKTASEGADAHKDGADNESSDANKNTMAHKNSAAHTEEGYTHRSKMNAQNHDGIASGEEPSEHGKPAAHNGQTAHDGQAAHGEKAQARQAAAETSPQSAIEKRSAKSAIKEETSNAATRVANDMAPAADPKKVTPAPTTLPSVATTAIGKYTVQVASYATENEAKEFATKLTTKGYSAFYVPAEVNGKTWYRVSVGLFADQKSATNYRTELLATQAVSSAIVQKIIK
jgi:cell division septation protein DedD